MSSLIHTDRLGPIDLARPLDYGSPFADGIEGAWIPINGHAGGTEVVDLTTFGYEGTRTDGASASSPSWASSAIVPFSGLDFSNNSGLTSGGGYISISTDPVRRLIQTNELTYFFWGHLADGSASEVLLGAVDENGLGDTNSIIDLGWQPQNTPPNLKAEFNGFGSPSCNVEDSSLTGRTVRIVVTYDGSDATMYVNGGEFQTTTAFGEDLTTRSVPPVFNIGRPNDDSRYFEGTYFGHAAWSDYKPASWVKSFDQEARRGFPALLNTRTTTIPLGAAAGQDLVRVVDETEQTTEATIASRALARIRNETTQISEAFLRPRALSRITTETAEVSETLVPSRSLLRVISETQNIQEGVVRIVRLLEVVDETVQVSETLARTRSLGRVVDETVEVSEVLVRPRTLARIVSETTQVSEGLIQSLGLLRTQSETVQISESTLRLLTILQVVNETVQLSESLVRSLSLTRVVDETLEITEGILSPRALVRVADETLQVSEGLVNVVRAITEGALTGTLELKARLTNSATELKERLSGFLNIEEK